jgi:hypothetical protein
MDTAAETAAVELFAVSGITITPVSSSSVQLPVPDLAALGTVRFTAPTLAGTAVLGASTGTLRRSSVRGTSDRDWIAELANQYLGRFKLKLIRAGFELWALAPVRVTGRLMITAVSQPEFTPLVFKDAKGGSVAVWIDFELNGPLKGTPSAPAEGEIPREGDLILF